jgi:hypothetical protein
MANYTSNDKGYVDVVAAIEVESIVTVYRYLRGRCADNQHQQQQNNE